MKLRKIFYCSLFIVSGCISFKAMGPGELAYSGLTVETEIAWNQAPSEVTPLSRNDSKTWTQDGILLDRIMIIPGVPSGEPIFKQTSRSQALPVFEANMLPNEIEELTESSIVKLLGEGSVVAETGKLRPQRYGDNKGIMFDIKVSVSDGPDYKGVAGAQIVSEKLYLILFLGAEPYYYQKHLDKAMDVIMSARVITSS
jgi:hypothetical protein